MAEGRLDRLKNLRARQRNNSISSPLSGSKSTDSGTVAVVSGPQLPRNADGTVKTKAHGNDAFSVGTMPWEPCAPRASLFLRIPTSVHEAEGTAVPLADPSLLWCLSLWSNDHRICHDVHTHVSAPPGRESSESGSNLFDSNTRVLRLDIIPPQTGTATLKVDLVHADVVLATSATQLTFELDAPPHVSTIELSGVSHGGTNVRLQATPAVSLAPYLPSIANILLFGVTNGHPVALAPFSVLYVRTRTFKPLPLCPSAPVCASSPLDYVHPGRSELNVTIRGLAGMIGDPLHLLWPSLTVAIVVVRGNGEIVSGPVVLGACKWHSEPATSSLSPPLPSTRGERNSGPFGLVSSYGNATEASGLPASDPVRHVWTTSWKRCVRIGVPDDASAAPAYTGRSNVHAMLYFLAPPSAVSAGKPSVVAFSYLLLHPESPQLLLQTGVHALKVYRGSPPFLPVDGAGDRLFSPTPCTESVGFDHVSSPASTNCSSPFGVSVPPHLRLLTPSHVTGEYLNRPLPESVTVHVTAISSFEVQDAVVNQYSVPLTDARLVDSTGMIDKVCVWDYRSA
jgi:hypothetical protein